MFDEKILVQDWKEIMQNIVNLQHCSDHEGVLAPSVTTVRGERNLSGQLPRFLTLSGVSSTSASIHSRYPQVFSK